MKCCVFSDANKMKNTLTVPAMSNPEANKSMILNAIYIPRIVTIAVNELKMKSINIRLS